MSILINMEMPKGCVSCFLKYGSCSSIRKQIAESKFDKWCPVNYRHPDCPLIEVPEHGRLIDADAEIEAIKKWENHPDEYIRNRNKDFINFLEEAPTVIPADKDGDANVP